MAPAMVKAKMGGRCLSSSFQLQLFKASTSWGSVQIVRGKWKASDQRNSKMTLALISKCLCLGCSRLVTLGSVGNISCQGSAQFWLK